MNARRTARFRSRAAGTAIAAALALGIAAAPAQAAPTPTVVLVHGAFADSSGWSDVADRLAADGIAVRTFDTPLRGIANDAARLTEFLAGIDGPIVLVGHSYGGAVITNTHDPDVTANVFVAAYAPERNQLLAELVNPLAHPGSLLLPPALLVKPVADPAGPAGVNLDAFVTEPFFREVFCQDVAPAKAAEMYRNQRTLAATANLERTGDPSWADTPSWYLVSTEDRVIPPALQRETAQRVAPGRTAEVAASHASYVSQPDAVAGIVAEAARAAG
ncbi:alpha/beta fold hydrolase [Nocardia sp. NPDC057353]|uniref:alpha/beta fold hydrolase n=1 Tax=Nocardia sp. NPDC057353 TaxID=3346104 RepID=UPI00363D0A4A